MAHCGGLLISKAFARPRSEVCRALQIVPCVFCHFVPALLRSSSHFAVCCPTSTLRLRDGASEIPAAPAFNYRLPAPLLRAIPSSSFAAGFCTCAGTYLSATTRQAEEGSTLLVWYRQEHARRRSSRPDLRCRETSANKTWLGTAGRDYKRASRSALRSFATCRRLRRCC